MEYTEIYSLIWLNVFTSKYYRIFPVLWKLVNGLIGFSYFPFFQLSSKCQNRLFCIRFHLPKMETYPFFETLSPPIRSISRNRNTRVSSTMWRRSSVLHPISQSSGLDEDMLEVEQNSLHETKPNSSSKRLRMGQDGISTTFRPDPMLEQPDEECNSHDWTANKVFLSFSLLAFVLCIGQFVFWANWTSNQY